MHHHRCSHTCAEEAGALQGRISELAAELAALQEQLAQAAAAREGLEADNAVLEARIGEATGEAVPVLVGLPRLCFAASLARAMGSERARA